MNVHVDDFREVADAPGDDDETFVFDGAGLRAVADAVVAGGGVGAEGDEEDFDALVGEDAAEFGEFGVVANEHGDFTRIGVEDLDFVSADHAPVVLLGGGDVDFVLNLVGAIAAAEVNDVVEPFIHAERHGAGDDVDVVFNSLANEPITDFPGMAGESPDGSRRAIGIIRRHERSVDIFREAHEVGLISTDGVDVELDHLVEGVDGRHGSHFQLDHSHADEGFAAKGSGLWLVGNVEPLEEGGVGLGFGVGTEVVGEDFFDAEVVTQLEGHDGIVDLLAADLIDVLTGGESVVLVVVGHAATGDDGAEVEVFANFLAGIIETSAQTEALVGGVDTDFDTVEDIAIGIMGGEGEVAGDLVVSMGVAVLVVVDDEGEGEGDDLSMVFDTDLSFGKFLDQFEEGLFSPTGVNSGIDRFGNAADVGGISGAEGADEKAVFSSLGRLLGHGFSER